MNDQRELFSPALLATRCPICGCTRPPGDEHTTDCGVDQSRKAGDWIRRPDDCLNTPRPETDPVPY